MDVKMMSQTRHFSQETSIYTLADKTEYPKDGFTESKQALVNISAHSNYRYKR